MANRQASCVTEWKGASLVLVALLGVQLNCITEFVDDYKSEDLAMATCQKFITKCKYQLPEFLLKPTPFISTDGFSHGFTFPHKCKIKSGRFRMYNESILTY